MTKTHPTSHSRAASLWRGLSARPRLIVAIAVGLALYALLPGPWALSASARALLAWNGGAWLYLLLVVHLMHASDTETMRKRALREDEGRFVVLAGVVLGAAAVLLAVGSQLGALKNLVGAPRIWHVTLAGLTVLSSWLFTQVLFALHYAHDFYLARSRKQADPLAFPGTADPGYSDFLYFACVIGTSGQTADVAFQGGALRRVGTLHCVLAFFFNTTLLALTINIAAGLLQPAGAG
jgi:uncharacterized membrane protein